jgi:hypothetical protein
LVKKEDNAMAWTKIRWEIKGVIMKKKGFLDERKYLLISLVITLLSSMQVGAMDAITTPQKKVSKKVQAYYNEQLARALYEGQSLDEIKKLPSFDLDCFLSLKYMVKPISERDEKAWKKRGKSMTDYNERLSFLAYFLIGGRKSVTPLQLAIWQGHTHLVRFLLELGANANLLSTNPYAKQRKYWAQTGHYGHIKNHPICYACCIVFPLDIALLVGKAEIAQILLDNGAVSTCHPAIAAVLWPEFVAYCNVRGISPFKMEFQKSVFKDETIQGFNIFFSPLVTEGMFFARMEQLVLYKMEDPVWFNARALRLILDSGLVLPLTNKMPLSYTGYYPWLSRAYGRKNEEIATLLLTYPFLVPVLPDYKQAKQRVLTALMILNRFRKNLHASHRSIPHEIFYLILRSTQGTALDMLAVLTGHLFERETVQKGGLITCSPAQKASFITLLTRYERVLPLRCVLPLLRNNFIEQQQQFLLQRWLVGAKKSKESFPQLEALDLLGDGFEELYGERIMENICAQLCMASPVELCDRSEALIVSFSSCSIGAVVFHFGVRPPNYGGGYGVSYSSIYTDISLGDKSW